MGIAPTKIDVDRAKGMTINWNDGTRMSYSLELLRSMCPCAICKEERAEKAKRKKTSLNVLKGDQGGELAIGAVDLVGNYALKIAWSDSHDTGIYTFEYLRELREGRHEGT